MQIAQAMGVVGTGLRGEATRADARWDDDFFPELMELKWPPEGRLVERDCTCDMWDRIRCMFFFVGLNTLYPDQTNSAALPSTTRPLLASEVEESLPSSCCR